MHRQGGRVEPAIGLVGGSDERQDPCVLLLLGEGPVEVGEALRVGATDPVGDGVAQPCQVVVQRRPLQLVVVRPAVDLAIEGAHPLRPELLHEGVGVGAVLGVRADLVERRLHRVGVVVVERGIEVHQVLAGRGGLLLDLELLVALPGQGQREEQGRPVHVAVLPVAPVLDLLGTHVDRRGVGERRGQHPDLAPQARKDRVELVLEPGLGGRLVPEAAESAFVRRVSSSSR